MVSRGLVDPPPPPLLLTLWLPCFFNNPCTAPAGRCASPVLCLRRGRLARVQQQPRGAQQALMGQLLGRVVVQLAVAAASPKPLSLHHQRWVQQPLWAMVGTSTLGRMMKTRGRLQRWT